jgi:two-component system cell cycle response regulator
VREGEAITILLVEDDPTDTHLLLQLLGHADVCPYSVQAVASAAEAEATLATSTPDVILLDLSLPDCDGVASVDRLLAAAPDTPVVVLTGRDDYALGLRSIEAGAQDFLVKGEAKGNAILRCAQWALARSRRRRGGGDAEGPWSALAASALPLALVGDDLVVRAANPAFESLVGCGPVEGLALTDLLAPDDVVGTVLDVRTVAMGESPALRRTISFASGQKVAVAVAGGGGGVTLVVLPD